MKKLLSLLVLVVTLLVLSGCSNKLDEIDAKDIFNQEGTYYVYFYKDGCPDCEKVKPVVTNYMDLLDEEKHEGKRKIYAVNVSEVENKSIFREYTKENGQGDGKFFVDGVTKYSDLYISSTSALILIGTDAKGAKIAMFSANGADNITTVLNNELQD